MTESDYISTTPRSGKAFTFTRIRGNASQQFLPGEGSRLHFANRATDTLELVDLPARMSSGTPAGFLQAGDVVTVQYSDGSSTATVFRGEVDHISFDFSRGLSAAQSATVTGPWAKMARLVMRQNWKTGPSAYSLSSRLILNQSDAGSPQTLNIALTEIAAVGGNATNGGACGYQPGAISVSTQILPFDPTRDITVADAIVRELKFFPAAVARMDYSTAIPTLNITMPDLSGSDAAYVAPIPKTARQYTYNANPINGVDLEIESTGDVDGVEYRSIDHQTAGSTAAGNPRCLYATLQLAGFSSSSVQQRFTAVSENYETAYYNGIDDPQFWRDKHPYLANLPANVTQSNLIITNATRSGSATASDYPYISGNTIGDIQAAGLRARVETFSCTAKITRTGGLNSSVYEIEDGVQLQMQFVTTNAVNGRTYTWTESSSATTGETVPTGLAAALLAARSNTLQEERFTMRLGTVAQWPKLGDICDGMVLQEFDVDLTDCTAALHFGTPDYLSPDDMAALMTGFRNKARAQFSSTRVSGKPGKDAESTVDMGGVMPLSSTEFSPGIKAKTTIESGSSSSSKVIELDSAELEAGEKMSIKTLTITKNESSATRGVRSLRTTHGDGENGIKILATEDKEIDLTCVESANNLTGAVTISGGNKIDVETSGQTIKISYNENKEDEEGEGGGGADCNQWADEEGEGGTGSGSGGSGGGGTGGRPGPSAYYGFDFGNDFSGDGGGNGGSGGNPDNSNSGDSCREINGWE